MTDVYELIIESARRLFTECTFESTSISAICKSAHVSRSTFYTYFEDKDDVLFRIIEADFTDRLKKLRSTLPSSIPKKLDIGVDSRMLNEWMYEILLQHKPFYTKIYKEQPWLLQNAFISSIESLNSEIFATYSLDKEELEYMAHFFAANHAMLIIKWISDGMTLDTRRLAGWYYNWSTRFVNEIALKAHSSKD